MYSSNTLPASSHNCTALKCVGPSYYINQHQYVLDASKESLKTNPSCKRQVIDSQAQWDVKLTGSVEAFTAAQEEIDDAQDSKPVDWLEWFNTRFDMPGHETSDIFSILIRQLVGLTYTRNDLAIDQVTARYDEQGIKLKLETKNETNLQVYDYRLSNPDYVHGLRDALSQQVDLVQDVITLPGARSSRQEDALKCYFDWQEYMGPNDEYHAWYLYRLFFGKILKKDMIDIVHNNDIDVKMNRMMKMQLSGLVKYGEVPHSTTLYRYVPLFMSKSAHNFFVQIRHAQLQRFERLMSDMTDNALQKIHTKRNKNELFINEGQLQKNMQIIENEIRNLKNEFGEKINEWEKKQFFTLSDDAKENLKKMTIEVALAVTVKMILQGDYNFPSWKNDAIVSTLQEKLDELIYIACFVDNGDNAEFILQPFGESMYKDSKSQDIQTVKQQAFKMFTVLTAAYTDVNVAPKMTSDERRLWDSQYDEDALAGVDQLYVDQLPSSKYRLTSEEKRLVDISRNFEATERKGQSYAESGSADAIGPATPQNSTKSGESRDTHETKQKQESDWGPRTAGAIESTVPEIITKTGESTDEQLYLDDQHPNMIQYMNVTYTTDLTVPPSIHEATLYEPLTDEVGKILEATPIIPLHYKIGTDTIQGMRPLYGSHKFHELRRENGIPEDIGLWIHSEMRNYDRDTIESAGEDSQNQGKNWIQELYEVSCDKMAKAYAFAKDQLNKLIKWIFLVILTCLSLAIGGGSAYYLRHDLAVWFHQIGQSVDEIENNAILAIENIPSNEVNALAQTVNRDLTEEMRIARILQEIQNVDSDEDPY